MLLMRSHPRGWSTSPEAGGLVCMIARVTRPIMAQSQRGSDSRSAKYALRSAHGTEEDEQARFRTPLVLGVVAIGRSGVALRDHQRDALR
ncbi:hypothetical protein GCM10010344_70940 [Streptomyces bluensis]|nr:hypothetical protein GCM10010344_70940 [Streptomyces bluensis]